MGTTTGNSTSGQVEDQTTELVIMLRQFLSEAEISALRSKIKPEQRKLFLKATPGNEDSVFAKLIWDAKKEAQDKMFSDGRDQMVYKLLENLVTINSETETVRDIAHLKVTEIGEECGSDDVFAPKRRAILAGLVRKEYLVGRTAIEPEKIERLKTLCEIFDVDIESLK